MKRRSIFPTITWFGKKGGHLSLSKKNVHLSLNCSLQTFGDGGRGEGCSRRERGGENRGSKCHMALREQQDELLPTQTLERTEKKRDSFAQCAPTCLPKAAPTSGVDEN